MCRAALLLALAALMGGCNSDPPGWTMFPPPILLQDSRLDFTRLVAPPNRPTDVDFLYATTLAPAPADAAERYQRRPGDQVRLGLARVHLGQPGWSFADLVESDRTNTGEATRPARVISVQEFGQMGGPA